MSVFVEGLAASSVTYSFTSPRSVLSAHFYSCLPACRRTPQLITTATGAYHAISFLLAFTVSSHVMSDVGLDWAAFLRNSLIGLGYCVDSTFDAEYDLQPLLMHSAPSAEKMPPLPNLSPTGSDPHINECNGDGANIPGRSSGNAISINSENNSEPFIPSTNISVTRPDPPFISYAPHPLSSAPPRPMHSYSWIAHVE
ncbi:hypothetical protein B0H13DRAFT_2386020 [Mycena leptocephala]|nr:hypothetical protein B0H13DRAFT_2386020 [Mycena leptocephala]